jgi:hypothetical protein
MLSHTLCFYHRGYYNFVSKLYGKINMQLNNNYPTGGLGELGCDPAERTAERCRPLEPDPGNAGGGKMKWIRNCLKFSEEFLVFSFSEVMLRNDYTNGCC